MSISTHERGNTIRCDIDYKNASNVLTDPSGSKAFLTVIKSDGTNLVADVSSSHTGTGEFTYFITSTLTDPLGIYIIQWKSRHSNLLLNGIDYGYPQMIQRDSIKIVDTEQD